MQTMIELEFKDTKMFKDLIDVQQDKILRK
jgi:hypothetical protein